MTKMEKSQPEKILVVRNDKLGDFMLAWPALALLKANLPQCSIHVLLSGYTAEIAQLCPSINQVVIDPGKEASFDKQRGLTKQLSQQQYDAVITLFSTTRIGVITWLSRIAYRLAPATKIAQLFYNQRLIQRRSRSEKPEYVYNQDLAIKFLVDTGITNPVIPSAPYLQFDESSTAQLRHNFCQSRHISDQQRLIFIHPGSGGSANNLSIHQYALLAKALHSSSGHHIVVSAGPDEIEQAKALATRLGDTAHTIYHSTEGLGQFAQHIACADLFISGSTGPLHIAGALNCRTVAFYPRRQSATALRWQTTNDEEKRLAFSPPTDAEEEDMSNIDPVAIAKQVNKTFLTV